MRMVFFARSIAPSLSRLSGDTSPVAKLRLVLLALVLGPQLEEHLRVGAQLVYEQLNLHSASDESMNTGVTV